MTAGSGIKSGSGGGAPAGPNQTGDVGISLMTGSLFVLGAQIPDGTSALVPESLRVYQNGLLLASGSNQGANDYTIVQYNFTYHLRKTALM